MSGARQCLEEIFELYRTGGGEKPTELLERVADLYFITLDQQSKKDRDAFGEAMEHMAFAAGPLARVRLAERVAREENVPVNLLRRLARDEICVARPVLQFSPCLREGDLVSIASDADQDHLLATALRRVLTTPVTDILVGRGEQEVLLAIAANVGAELSPEGLAKITKIAGEDAHISRVMNMRRDLVPSNPLRSFKRLAAANFWHNAAEALLMTEEKPGNRETPQQKTAQPAKTPPRTQERKRPGKPEPEPAFSARSPVAEKGLVDAARGGKAEEAVKALARIARLDEGMTEHCLFRAQVPALMVLCKAYRLAPATFTALLQLREARTGEAVNDTVGLMRRYEGMTPHTAQRIIRFSEKRRAIEGDEEFAQAAAGA